MGSGRWVGQSVQNHPDFAWYPYVVMPENPQVDYEKVKQIIGAAGDTTPNDPPGTHPNRPPGTPGTHPNRPPGAQPGTTPPGTQPGTTPGTTPGTPPGIYDPSGAQGLAIGAMPISPIQLVATIAEKTSSFGLDVTVDRFDGGQYAIGEPYFVRGTSERPGYLYLLHIDSQGVPTLLFPAAGESNRVLAQRSFAVGVPNTPQLIHRGPVGTHRIKAVVTDRPLMLSGLVWQGQSTQQKGLYPRRVYRPFRWCPTQRMQVQGLLLKYQQQQQIPPAQVDNFQPRKRFVAFAQDEVAFYVGPPGTAKPPVKQ
jgi:hypothetical protein